jgi:hypothetical protein
MSASFIVGHAERENADDDTDQVSVTLPVEQSRGRVRFQAVMHCACRKRQSGASAATPKIEPVPALRAEMPWLIK